MKITWTKIKDYVYILTLIGVGCGWFVDHRVTKFKNEMKDQVQDDKIAVLETENGKLKLESEKQKGYVEENANNIDWIVRIFVLEPE